MNKLKEINGYAKLTLDKLLGIIEGLVGFDVNQQEWDFAKLVDSLRRWTDRKSKHILNNDQKYKRKGIFHTKELKQPPLHPPLPPSVCVFTVKSVEDCRLILSKRKLCFNWTGTKHRVSDCRNNALCLICNLKHHTSICDKNENVLLTTYFLVTAKIQGIKSTVMQIEKELINDRLRCLKVS